MRQGLVAIVALALLGAAAEESRAQNLTSNTIMGRWCGESSTYYFTADKITVSFPNGSERVLHITSIDVDGLRIVVNWAEDGVGQSADKRGQGSHTTFSQFSGGKMVQVSEKRDDGVPTPTRVFRRC